MAAAYREAPARGRKPCQPSRRRPKLSHATHRATRSLTLRQLPTGTVTFLFSDIEGSTRLVRSLGEAWPRLLSRHQELMRAAFTAHGGVEVTTEGDSFFVAFPSAAAAIAAAADAQRALVAEPWPEGAEIRVRIGLHSGEGTISDDTYVGLDVHRAARIAAAGHGGQVLVSETTRGLAAQSLPDGVTLRPLGRHRLKDLGVPEEIHQADVEGLPSTFPALTSLDAIPNNLPTQMTTFLGREREIAEISGLLESARVLTLTGPGGTGKTRLSLQVAARTSDSYADGVFFVPLGLINETSLVMPTIAHEVGLPDRGGTAPLERLAAHLADRSVLLVLDNFEQVVDAGPMLAELLGAAPRVRALVTSRSPLRIYGEQEYPVPPLGSPDPSNLPPLHALSQFEAVGLFLERARAIQPGFVLDDGNAPAVAEIAYRLDGLPLAIELAAARIKLLSPQAILARLGNRLALLGGGARDLPARQQTLRGAIAWSYDLLDEPDRELFASLSVFAGSVSFEAVEAVCHDLDVFEGLASLVEKSLLTRREGSEGEPRFQTLSTIREFAAEQLEARDRRDQLRRRHAEWYLDLAEQAASVIMGPDQRRWLDRLQDEHDNLRAALAWLVEAGEARMAMRMTASLWRFWQMRGYLIEGLERARAALAIPGGEAHPECRADALDAAAGLAYWLGDGPLSTSLYDEELELRRRLGDRAGEAWILYSKAFAYNYADPGGGGIDLAIVELAHQSVVEALAIYRELGDDAGTARALWALATTEWMRGDSEASRLHTEEAITHAEELGDRFLLSWALYTASLLDLQLETNRQDAASYLARSLRTFAESEDVTGYTLVIDAIALLALQGGERERAALLSGAVAVLERRSGTGLNPSNRAMLKFDPLRLRDDAETSDAWAAGERLSVEEAIACALETADAAAAAPAPPTVPG